MDKTLTHVDSDGSVQMVDVGSKQNSVRKAKFRSTVQLSPKTFQLLQDKALSKGDVLTTAKIAGIQAAKQTAHIIPMCHPIFLTHIDISFFTEPKESCIYIEAEAQTTAPTGVEMEALVAVQVAAMTIYDMCKAVQRDITINDCHLVYKTGGKSGTYEKKQ